MIGQDFYGTCNERHIIRRIGDGDGRPLAGPLKICSLRMGIIAALTSDGDIVIFNLRGYTEHVYHPLSSKDSVLKRKAEQEARREAFGAGTSQNENAEEDWQLAFLKRSGVSVTDLSRDIDQGSEDAPFSFLDMQATNICKVVDRNSLVITDSRYCVHILDLHSHSIIHTFGRGGRGPGEFAAPSAAATLAIDVTGRGGSPSTFYFIGDSQTTQKVRVFWPDFTQAADIGELGPALGQFRDITSISCFDPNVPTSIGPDQHAYLGSASADSATAPLPTAISAAPAVDESEGLPSWYRGKQHFEDLEAMLYEDTFHGNFLIAQRKKRVFLPVTTVGEGEDYDLEGSVDSEDLVELPASHRFSGSGSAYSLKGSAGTSVAPATAAVGGNSSTSMRSVRSGSASVDASDSRSATRPGTVASSVAAAAAALAATGSFSVSGAEAGQHTDIGDEDDQDDPDEEKTYDLLFISKAKKLDHIVIRENNSPAFEPGYYVSNSVDPVRTTYPCLMDLIRAQKQHTFTLGGDSRKFVFVAVCDQGNFRVQVFRFYWTKSFMFRPELRLAHVVGGAQKRHVELFDPMSVAYTPSGELAVCDAATNKVHVLSPHMDLIKTVAIPFCSTADLPLHLSHHNSPQKQAMSTALTMAQGDALSPGDVGFPSGAGSGGAGSGAGGAISKANASDKTESTTGMDYLQYLEQSVASKITFTDRELHPEKYEHEEQLPKPGSRQAITPMRLSRSSATLRADALPLLTATSITGASSKVTGRLGGQQSSKLGGTLQSLSRGESLRSLSETGSVRSGGGAGGGDEAASTAGGRTVTISSKLSHQDSYASFSSKNSGGGFADADRRPASTPKAAAKIDPKKTAAYRKKHNAKYLSTYNQDSKLSPESLAQKKKRKMNRQPCSLTYSPEGQLIVAYKSGGIFVYSGYETYPVGVLRRLQVSTLEHVLRFLSYPDIESLRNCCLFLHNFTKELRLSWRLFGPARTISVMRVVSLFLQWAKVDNDGVVAPQFQLKDAQMADMCPRYLRLECEDPFCAHSHQPIAYDRADLARLEAYIVYTDFLHFVSVIFGPKFLWQFEPYIAALFEAYGADRTITVRHDAMTRNHETVRTQEPSTVRVLYFLAYLELMTLLEEQRSGMKDIHSHKLFRRQPRRHFVPSVDYRLDAIEKRMVVGPYEQYGRAIDVPYKRSKGKKLISLKGMEHAERTSSNPVEEHCAVFNCHANKAADLINRMFS